MTEENWDYDLSLSHDHFMDYMPVVLNLMDNFQVCSRYTYFIRFFFYLRTGDFKNAALRNINDETLLNYI